MCRIDGSDNLLAGLLRGASLSPWARGEADRVGQAALYLPAAWPTRAAAAMRVAAAASHEHHRLGATDGPSWIAARRRQGEDADCWR